MIRYVQKNCHSNPIQEMVIAENQDEVELLFLVFGDQMERLREIRTILGDASQKNLPSTMENK